VGRAVRRARDAAEGRALIANEFDPLLVRAMGEEGVERIRAAVIAAPEPPARPRLQWQEVRAAILVFLLVFLSTFPVILPFVFIPEIQTAKRVSAAVAISLLFVCGYTWGKYAGQSPLRVGSVMVLLGVVIEAAVIALGG
jgi:VIT1/CCC1 family predicted Fe2+/Mn2+ transporter